MMNVMVPFRLREGVWKEDENVSYFTSNDLTMLDEVEVDCTPKKLSVEYHGQRITVTVYVAPDGETGYVREAELN
jgi:hypothetical protein